MLTHHDVSPSLLILHGFSESMETWGEVVQKLPKTIHILTLDLPGQGRAPLQFNEDSPDSTATFENYANFVRHFIRTICLDQFGAGLHVLGHSMGATIAAQLAASHGGELNVRWLTLAAPAMRTPVGSPCWHAICEGKFEEWNIPTTLEGTRFMLMKTTGMTGAQANTFKNRGIIKGVFELRLPQTETLRQIWLGLERDMNNFSEVLASWKNIRAKTHVIWGTADLIIDCSGGETLKATISDCRVDLLEGVPHALNLVAPEKVAASIVSFRESAAREDEGGGGAGAGEGEGEVEK